MASLGPAASGRSLQRIDTLLLGKSVKTPVFCIDIPLKMLIMFVFFGSCTLETPLNTTTAQFVYCSHLVKQWNSDLSEPHSKYDSWSMMPLIFDSTIMYSYN